MPSRSIRRFSPRFGLIEAIALVIVALTVLAVGPVRAGALDKAMQAVLSVHSADEEDRFLGSAFLWGPLGEVAVTNAHVVGDSVEVRLVDASGAEEIATVIARDAVRDVAVLSVSPGRRGLIPSPVVPGLGTEVFALGAPLGIEFSMTGGMISAVARQVAAVAPIRMLQHDAAVNPGSSGGPLVDAQGALVGMNSLIADGSRLFVGIAFAIPTPDLQRIVQGLIDETLQPLPELGLKVRLVDRQLAAVLVVDALGLLVDEVISGGLADQSGLRAGDIVLALGGNTLKTEGDLAFALEAAQAKGQRTDLSIRRGGARVLLSLSFVVPGDAQSLALRDVSGAGPQKVTDYTLSTLGMTVDGAGVVIDLTPNSPALLAGIAVGDRITQVNGATVASDALGQMVFARAVLVLVQTGGHTRHVLIDPFTQSRGLRPVGGANVLDPDVVVF